MLICLYWLIQVGLNALTALPLVALMSATFSNATLVRSYFTGKQNYSPVSTCMESYASQLFTPVLVSLSAHGVMVACSIEKVDFQSIFLLTHTLL